jgi:hypothetical protein
MLVLRLIFIFLFIIVDLCCPCGFVPLRGGKCVIAVYVKNLQASVAAVISDIPKTRCAVSSRPRGPSGHRSCHVEYIDTK